MRSRGVSEEHLAHLIRFHLLLVAGERCRLSPVLRELRQAICPPPSWMTSPLASSPTTWLVRSRTEI